jgi:glycosyltransferase involved in cell wall biosynthesis
VTRVLYVLSKFPCYDEAFLLREIHGVSQRIDTWIFSLRAADETVVHDAARALVARTLYVPFLFSWRLAAAHARVLATRPLRYLRALARVVAGNWRSPGFLARNLVLFPKSVWLAQWALDNGVSHVHGGWATYPASVALTVAEITGLPWSFSGHAHDIYLDTTQLAEKLRSAAFVSTCTASNAVHLRALAPELSAERIAVLHHGVRLADFPAARRSGPLHILSVGTLNPHKGFAPLVDALALLAREGREFRCTIVGGGPLEAALRARIAEAGLESRVQMTGALPQSEVLPRYGESSVFVLMAQPEWHWGIPNVIIEALAARNAVVTTRFGSVEELVKDGETGLIVPPKDPAALAAALRRLADVPELRQQLAEAGHSAVARDFDLDSAVAWYVERFGGRPA